jgi:hypothetical protein
VTMSRPCSRAMRPWLNDLHWRDRLNGCGSHVEVDATQEETPRSQVHFRQGHSSDGTCRPQDLKGGYPQGSYGGHDHSRIGYC